MIIKYAIAWIPMLFIAVVNGALREFVFAKTMPELFAHQLSCLTAIVFFGVFTWLLSLRWPLRSTRQAMNVGLLWFVLTVVFETSAGYQAVGPSWDRLFRDYNVLAGRLWVLVLLAILVLPLIVFKLRRKPEAAVSSGKPGR